MIEAKRQRKKGKSENVVVERVSGKVDPQQMKVKWIA